MKAGLVQGRAVAVKVFIKENPITATKVVSNRSFKDIFVPTYNTEIYCGYQNGMKKHQQGSGTNTMPTLVHMPEYTNKIEKIHDGKIHINQLANLTWPLS
jgi:hypothetical protein